jgi:hypothetical protein
MIISDEKWTEIINETKAGINMWSARAVEHGCDDSFSIEQHNTGVFSLIATMHRSKYDQLEVKALAWNGETGEVRAAKPMFKKGVVIGFKMKPVPKAWKSLTDKTAKEIVGKVGLLKFILILGSQMTAHRV